jgi:hypothetical protein
VQLRELGEALESSMRLATQAPADEVDLRFVIFVLETVPCECADEHNRIQAGCGLNVPARGMDLRGDGAQQRRDNQRCEQRRQRYRSVQSLACRHPRENHSSSVVTLPEQDHASGSIV